MVIFVLNPNDSDRNYFRKVKKGVVNLIRDPVATSHSAILQKYIKPVKYDY